MEDIGQTIKTVKKLIRCNDIEEARKLKRKFEKLNPEQDMKNCGMLSLDQLIKQTKDLVNEVKGLPNNGKFPKRIDLDEKRGLILSVSKLAGETTAKRNMEKIYDFIIGDVRKIGVYGMGGIGKTTVMKHINNRILKEQEDKFDYVIWVTVSKDSSIFKLQDDIANMLEVNLSKYKDTTTRAGALLKAFQQKGRYLLILDDLWEGYPLEDVGIPDPDNSDYANGCKLALTTRSLDVCQSMKCKTIKMDLLSKEEARSLFFHHVGHDVLQSKVLVPIVENVVSECACLPLAIAIIARSMAGKKEVCDWRDTLLKLRAFSKEPGDKRKRVIEQLKFSYDSLENKRLQKCLLLCALYPEDEIIERRELIKLLALEGILEEKEYMSDEIDEGNAMLNNLINKCLLESEETYPGNPVKMHDLVRDMALQIDSLHSQYLTVSGIELSDVKWSNDLLKIHISKCYSSNVSPMCHRLTTFILNDRSLANIPDSFFQHFKALKILNLFGCHSLKVLPKSISDLVKLVGLLLRECYSLTYVPHLARLKDLQVLDFDSNSDLLSSDLGKSKDFMIEGLEELNNLRYVNLSIFHIEVFPPGIIPRLSNLRCLVCSPFTKINVIELMGLKNLEMFKGAFHDIHDLCVYAKHIEQKRSQLTSYIFRVGSGDDLPVVNSYYRSNFFDKVMILKECNLSKDDEYLIPKDVQHLMIDSVPDLTSFGYLASLQDLRSCEIIECDEVRELVSNSTSSSFVLSSLEHLTLLFLENLKSLIGRNKKACNVFPCLRELQIIGCSRMKVVINIGLLSNLNNLEFLSVNDCKEVEEIIGEWLDDEKDVNEGITQITLPKLRMLWLERLPHLRYICPASRTLICKSLHEITIKECPEVKQCVYVGWDERGEPSPSASLQSIQLKSPMEKWSNEFMELGIRDLNQPLFNQFN